MAIPTISSVLRDSWTYTSIDLAINCSADTLTLEVEMFAPLSSSPYNIWEAYPVLNGTGTTHYHYVIAVYPTGTNIFSGNPLSPGTFYTFKVRAVNGDGASDWVFLDTTTQNYIASQIITPVNLISTGVTDNTVSLSWSYNQTPGNYGADYIYLYYQKGTPTVVGYSWGAEVSHTVPNSLGISQFSYPYTAGYALPLDYIQQSLLKNTTYRFSVAAQWGGVISSRSNYVTITTTNTGTEVIAPTLLTVVQNNNTAPVSYAADVTWQDNSINEDSFRIQIYEGVGFTNLVSDTTAYANTTSYGRVGIGLSVGTTYRFIMQAKLGTNYSVNSNYIDLTVTGAGNTLPVPSNTCC